jgi:cell division septal protein FtsQ
MRIKYFQQKIKNFFLTNFFWRKIKITLNGFIKPILVRVFFGLIAITFIALIAIQIYKPKLSDQIKNKGANYFYRYFKLDNFEFSSIHISGNKRVKDEEIIAIIKNFELEKGALIGKNLDNIDLLPLVKNLIDKIKLQLNWIDKVTIKRSMPDILNVEIEEYHPFAIWINDDKKFIIDKEGNSIPFLEEYEQSEEFKNMIILSGVGANQNAKSLFNILVINSEISQDIYSANWVGNRRWDIRFFDGLLVKLPEIEISNAWHDLIKIYSASKNDKAIKSIDLRVSGKIYLQYYNKKSFEINLRKI